MDYGVTGGPICANCGEIIKIMSPPCACREGKTMIGTCGGCRWWNHADKDKQSEWKKCQQFDYDRPGGCVELNGFYTRKNFGCNQWKAKEKQCQSE